MSLSQAIESLMHSHTVQHHRRLTGTKLYCLVTETHVCEQLAQGRYVKVEVKVTWSKSAKTRSIGRRELCTPSSAKHLVFFCNLPGLTSPVVTT